MRHTKLTLAILLAVSLSGCVMRGNPLGRSKKAAAVKPVASVPVVAQPAPPPPPPAPLSIPQTNVRLPDPQPISAEALATTLPAEAPPQTSAPAAEKPAAKRPTAPAAATPAATPPTPAAEPDRPILQEVMPPSEQNRLHDETAAATREARLKIAQVEQRPVSAQQQKNTIDRIMSFLRQAEDMEKQSNFRQANELALKALALARELK